VSCAREREREREKLTSGCNTKHRGTVKHKGIKKHEACSSDPEKKRIDMARPPNVKSIEVVVEEPAGQRVQQGGAPMVRYCKQKTEMREVRRGE